MERRGFIKSLLALPFLKPLSKIVPKAEPILSPTVNPELYSAWNVGQSANFGWVVTTGYTQGAFGLEGVTFNDPADEPEKKDFWRDGEIL